MTKFFRGNLALIFIFLYGFKVGVHIVTQVWQGPLWGGLLFGCFMGSVSAAILKSMLPKPPKPIDPLHQNFLDQLDTEFSKIKEDYVRRTSN